MKRLFIFLVAFLYLLPVWATDTQASDIIKDGFHQLVQWEYNDSAPLTGQQGYTPWQQFTGGRARFVSCNATIPTDGILLTGIQVILNPNTILQKPIIQTDFAAQQTKILYPLEHPLSAGKIKTDSYQGTVFFPIIFHLNETNQSIEIPVHVTLPFISATNSNTEQVSFQLTLQPADFTFTTPMCGALMDTLQKTPIPADGHITGNVTQQNARNLTLSLDFSQTPTALSVQVDNPIEITPTQYRLQENKAIIHLQTAEPIAPDTVLNFKIITPDNWYDLPLQITPEINQTASHQTDLPWLGLLSLIFFSPFWLTMIFTPKKTRTRTAKILLICTPVLFITHTLLQITYAPLTLIYPSVWQPLIAAVLTSAFIVTVKRAYASLPVLLTLLTPYPFLSWLNLIQAPFTTQLICTLLMSAVLCLPLLLTCCRPNIINRIQKNIYVACPLILLILCLLLNAAAIQSDKLLPTYEKPAAEGLSLVIYEQPTSFTTLGYNLFVFPFNPYQRWQETNRLHLYRARFENITADSHFPTYRLLNADGQEILRLEHAVSTDSLRQTLISFMR